jgi:tetratricopeptide (TPR) repeat protein
MQQYRVNFPLLIGLAVGTLISSGAVYGLWKFQTERRSGYLITEAQQSFDKGDLKGAQEYYAQYIRIKPTDVEQRVKFAELSADIAEKFDASLEDRQRAISILESTLRDFPTERGLRLRLAQMYAKWNVTKDALDHLSFILDDPQAQLLRAQLLARTGDAEQAIPYSYKLIGYDPATDKFDPEKPGTAPNDPNTYLALALLLRKEGNRNELADRVIEQVAKANPDNPLSYLVQGQYRYQTGDIELALEDFEKAYKLGPEDAEVLAVMATQAMEAKDYPKATSYVEKGLKLHPKDVRFYILGSAIKGAQQDYPGALAEIEAGLKQIPPPGGYELMIRKVELQLAAKERAEARKTIADMRLGGIRREYCDWYEARVLMDEEKWHQANGLLVELRPLLAADPRFSVHLNYSLGLSYQKLGKHDLAIRSFEDVLKQMPEHEPAKYGLTQSKINVGNVEDVAAADPLQRAVDAELAKEKAKQDWTAVESIIEKIAKDRELSETDKKLFWGRVLLARQEWEAARRLAAELYRTAPDHSGVQLLALEAVRRDPAEGQGPKQALVVMDRLKLKDQPSWRLFKADLYLMMNDEQTKPQLASLLADIDSWSVQEKLQLWSGMSERFLALNPRMYDEARRLLQLVAKENSEDLETQKRLFQLALETNDEDGVKAAQEGIRKIVGSQNDAEYLATEARRQLWMIRRGRQSLDSISQIRSLLERARERRPEWYELFALSAEVELLANNFGGALKFLDQAEDLGRLSPQGVAQHVRLLASDGQLTRAAQRMNDIPEALRPILLEDLYTELMFRTNKIDEAVKAAQVQADAQPNNAVLHYRHGQLLARSTERPGVTEADKKATLERAIKAMEQAVKANPEFSDAWYSLILFNAMADKDDQAQKALRDVQLSLSGDSLQFVLAKCFEALGRWFDAEPMYRAVYEADPTNIERAQQLAAFYIGPGYTQADRRDKAAPLINQILRAGAEGKIPPSDKNLLWARRTGARILASSGDYQQLLQAEKMLTSNTQDGALSIEDRLELAQILAPRPDPQSRLTAVHLLEEVDRAQPLNEKASQTLGELHYRLGNWSAAQTQFRRSFQRFPDSAPLRTRYTAMLLQRGGPNDLKEAEQYVEKLGQLAPSAPETFQLSALWRIKTGETKVVHDRINSIVDPILRTTDLKTIPDAQVPMLDVFSALLVELKDLDRAEKLQRLLAKRDPKRNYALAQFIGHYRDVAQAFDMLDAELKPDEIREAIRVGTGIIRARRAEIGDKFDARVETWLNRGLNSNPGSIPLMLSKAEFLQVQRKYAEAIATYRELLPNPDIVGFGRAVMLNNLAYLTALAEAGTTAGENDPLKLVQQAEFILGPTADILDTRAMVYIARKQYDLAIADLELSVTDNPTAAKYFHKAIAHSRNRQNKDAIDAWNEAVRLGLSRDELDPLEQPIYDSLKTQIESLRGSGV